MNCKRGHFRFAIAGVGLVVGVVLMGGCSRDEHSAADLAGADVNHNRVRDDVDDYIAGRNPAYVDFLTAVAVNEQRAVTLDVNAPGARAEAFEILDKVNLFVSCPPAELDPHVARDETSLLSEKVANTRQRRANRDRVSSINSGRSMPAPDCSVTSEKASSTTTLSTDGESPALFRTYGRQPVLGETLHRAVLVSRAAAWSGAVARDERHSAYDPEPLVLEAFA